MFPPRATKSEIGEWWTLRSQRHRAHFARSLQHDHQEAASRRDLPRHTAHATTSNDRPTMPKPVTARTIFALEAAAHAWVRHPQNSCQSASTRSCALRSRPAPAPTRPRSARSSSVGAPRRGLESPDPGRKSDGETEKRRETPVIPGHSVINSHSKPKLVNHKREQGRRRLSRVSGIRRMVECCRRPVRSSAIDVREADRDSEAAAGLV